MDGEGRMEEKAGETGDPGENLLTCGISRYDSHVRNKWSNPAGKQTRLVLAGVDAVGYSDIAAQFMNLKMKFRNDRGNPTSRAVMNGFERLVTEPQTTKLGTTGLWNFDVILFVVTFQAFCPDPVAFQDGGVALTRGVVTVPSRALLLHYSWRAARLPSVGRRDGACFRPLERPPCGNTTSSCACGSSPQQSSSPTLRGHHSQGNKVELLASFRIRFHRNVMTSQDQRGRGGVMVRLLASHLGEPAGFIGDLRFLLPLHSGASPYSPHFTLIGSQDLDVKSWLNHSNPRLGSNDVASMASHTCRWCSLHDLWLVASNMNYDVLVRCDITSHCATSRYCDEGLRLWGQFSENRHTLACMQAQIAGLIEATARASFLNTLDSWFRCEESVVTSRCWLFQLIGIICMACASPALLPGSSWFLFVVVTSFIATLVWAFIYLLGIREALKIPINWILTECRSSEGAGLAYPQLFEAEKCRSAATHATSVSVPLSELLNTAIITVLYLIAFIVQLSVWAPYSHFSTYGYYGQNIAAGMSLLGSGEAAGEERVSCTCSLPQPHAMLKTYVINCTFADAGRIFL
ncbi:hypothetical protein PR048_016879 [Dryococelus australis]|uniref:MARVEL domain-containing protein n=1 Tax=Dryococelus australis TaxID=614101 RepID=A0ABQ9H7X4_9NEOP|nr:hypothetical protein PR048_016879 [Dryococelus australis]